MTTTRPDTAFVGGVCSACLSHEKRKGEDWAARREDLVRLLDRHHGECLVASSGGKDSTYIAVTLQAMGANVTTVTATTDDLTALGRQNLDNLRNLCDGYEVTLNQSVRRKIARIGLRTVGDISYAEHVAIWTIPMRMSVALRKPLLFYGECPQAQYGAPLDWDGRQEHTRQWVAEFGGLNGLRVSDLVGQDGIKERDLELFRFPPDADLAEVGTTAYYLGSFVPWDSQHNAKVARDHGFRWNPDVPYPASYWRAENLDNAQTPLHDYFCFLKYGFGRVTAQCSADIRAGRLLRATALDIVTERDWLPPTHCTGAWLTLILERIGVSTEEWGTLCDKYANRELLEKRDGVWRLKP